MRWRFTLARNEHHHAWSDVPRTVRFGMKVKLGVALLPPASGGPVPVLRDDEPVAGWMSNRIARDGKDWPCGEGAHGARPAWIWTGDIA